MNDTTKLGMVGVVMAILLALFGIFLSEQTQPVDGELAGTLFSSCESNAPACLIRPGDSSGKGSLNWSALYDNILVKIDSQGNATRSFGGKLVVPWFKSSTACGVINLQNASNCNLYPGTLNFADGYCQVSDEHSQVCVIYSAGKNESQMRECSEAIKVMKCNLYGQIPGWRGIANETSGNITMCDSRVNSNNDTASDATARYIISLFTAAANPFFTNQTYKDELKALAINLTIDMDRYEVQHTCYNSSLGFGPICDWMAGGSVARNNGLGSTDFAFTGYYQDVIAAYLMAYSATGNATYLTRAGNITLNYMQAAYPNNTGLPVVGNLSSFRVPPGKSFKWVNLTTNPAASCTNTCSPDQWDTADAPRAFGMCMVEFAANNFMNIDLPLLSAYCDVWATRYMTITNSLPIQYYSNGTASASNQSGFKAQGWQAQGLMSQGNETKFNITLFSVFSHYSETTGQWDSAACFGVYDEMFGIRALYSGLARDYLAYNGTVISSNVSITNQRVNATTGDLNAHILINATIASTSAEISTALSTVRYPNGTLQNITMTRRTIVTENITPGNSLSLNFSFCSTDQGFSGYDAHDTTQCSLNKTSGSGNLFSPDIDLETNYSNSRVQEIVVFNYTNGTNNKYHPTEVCGSVPSNNRFNFESQNSTHFHIKADRGTFSDTNNYPYGVLRTANFTTIRNSTGNYSRACVGTDCTDWEVFAPNAGAEDCIAIEFSNFLTGGKFLLYQVNVTANGTASSSVNVTTNTSTWQANWTSTAVKGRYNVTFIFANDTTGISNNLTNPSNMSFFIGTNLAPNVTLLLPLNGSTVFVNQNYTFNVTDDIDTSLACTLYANFTGSYLPTSNVTGTNGTGGGAFVSLHLASPKNFIWNYLCTDSEGLTDWAAVNYTFTITFAANNATLCPNMTSIRFKANISLGNYTPSTNTYYQANLTPVNHTACGYDYVLNNTITEPANYTFWTNLTEPTFILQVNGARINRSTNVSIVVNGSGNVTFVNITLTYNQTALTRLRIPFDVNVTGVAS